MAGVIAINRWTPKAEEVGVLTRERHLRLVAGYTVGGLFVTAVVAFLARGWAPSFAYWAIVTIGALGLGIALSFVGDRDDPTWPRIGYAIIATGTGLMLGPLLGALDLDTLKSPPSGECNVAIFASTYQPFRAVLPMHSKRR